MHAFTAISFDKALKGTNKDHCSVIYLSDAYCGSIFLSTTLLEKTLAGWAGLRRRDRNDTGWLEEAFSKNKESTVPARTGLHGNTAEPT